MNFSGKKIFLASSWHSTCLKSDLKQVEGEQKMKSTSSSAKKTPLISLHFLTFLGRTVL